MVDITLTGSIGLAHGAATVTSRAFGGRHTGTLLAVLVVERHRPLSRDVLIDALWSGSPPPSAESMLRTAMARLRAALAQLGPDAGIALTADQGGYHLWLPPGTRVDVEEAARLVDEAEALLDAGGHADARMAAAAAGAVLARPLLAGVEATWLDRQRQRLDDLGLRALEAEAAGALGARDTAACIAAAEAVVVRAPFRESAYRLLMQAHWAAGNRGEALRAYSHCRTTLATELGVDPAPPTEELYLALLGPATEPEPWPTTDAGAGSDAIAPRTGRPPAPEASLVGRDGDLARVTGLLAQTRLVTLIGFGGVGKTRLAAAVAASFPSEDGVRWVDLSTSGPEGVAPALMHAVGGTRHAQAPLESAIATLGSRHELVVLDNCEHVPDEAAATVRAVLTECPNVRVLATSRSPLGLPEEQIAPVDPLPVPAPGEDVTAIRANPAVELFVQRARTAGADLAIGEANAATIADICRRLDGLPLAIELAAARVRSVGPTQIADHLDDRFRLLHRRGAHASSARHRSLDEAVRWSYDLLDERARRLFPRLSVFAGSFSVDARSALVAGDDDVPDALALLDVLAELVDQSMVVASTAADPPRYHLLETLRDYGRLRLDEAGETTDACERHAAYFLALVEASAVGLQGPDEGRWVETLHAEMPNITAAFAHVARSVDVDRALRFALGLFDYAFFRMRSDVADLVEEAVALPGADSNPLYGVARAAAGYLAWEQGALDKAIRHLLTASTHDDTWITADAWGTVSLFRGNTDEGLAAYDRAAAHAVRLDNSYLLAVSRSQQSFTHMLAGLDDAMALAESSEEAAAASGSPTALAQAAWALGLAHFDHDPVTALAHLERAVALARQVDNRMAVGAAADPADALRSKLTRRPGPDDLLASIDQLEYWVREGNPPNVWSAARRIVRQLAALGMYEDAATLAAAEAAATLKIPAREREATRHRAVVEHVRRSMTPTDHDRAVAAAASLSEADLIRRLRRAAAARPARSVNEIGPIGAESGQ